VGVGRIYYQSTSRRLIDDVAQLLLRLGVQSRIARVRKMGYPDCWHLRIDSAEDQTAFLTKVGVHGARGKAAELVLDQLGSRARHPSGDTVPIEVWDKIREATSDVFWDRIVEITSIGEHDVYDGTVNGTHNFVANGINLHNSLEQDADVVILLHRPDAFDRDDPRGGEADFILAKHRNGPTKTVTVAHQLHLSRFANMAR